MTKANEESKVNSIRESVVRSLYAYNEDMAPTHGVDATEVPPDAHLVFQVDVSGINPDGVKQINSFSVRCNSPEEAKAKAIGMSAERGYSDNSAVKVELSRDSDYEGKNDLGSPSDTGVGFEPAKTLGGQIHAEPTPSAAKDNGNNGATASMQ